MSQLKDIYRKIPGLKCKGLCSESCSFIIIGKKEKSNFERIGIEGNFVLHEQWTDTVDLQGISRKCSKLSECGKCTIYNDRPLICRLFGVVKKMSCPFGCKPERWMTDDQARKLMKKVGME